MTAEGPPLSPEVSALLDRERQAPSPSPFLRARALARARAAVVAAGPVRRTVTVPGGRSRMHWAVAATMTSLASVAVGASAYHLSSRWNHAVSPPGPASKAGPAAFLSQEAGPSGKPRGAIEELPAPSSAPAIHRPLQGRGNENVLRILRLARAAVAREDFAVALRSIADHTRRFPDGELVEEREALHVKALAGLGRAEDTRRTAVAFRRRFPNSILLPAIEQLAAGALLTERRPP
jgi:hypothetical protein